MRFISLCILAALAPHAYSKPIGSGGGKYGRCKTSYDSCMSKNLWTPGSQSYNVAKSRCYKSWKSCVGIGALAVGTGSPVSDIQAIEYYEKTFIAPVEGIEDESSDSSEWEAPTEMADPSESLTY